MVGTVRRAGKGPSSRSREDRHAQRNHRNGHRRRHRLAWRAWRNLAAPARDHDVASRKHLHGFCRDVKLSITGFLQGLRLPRARAGQVMRRQASGVHPARRHSGRRGSGRHAVEPDRWQRAIHRARAVLPRESAGAPKGVDRRSISTMKPFSSKATSPTRKVSRLQA